MIIIISVIIGMGWLERAVAFYFCLIPNGP